MNSCFSGAIKLLCIPHLVRLLVTRAQEVGYSNWAFEILKVDPPLLREQSVDLGAPCNLCYTRGTKYDTREYGKTMRRDTLLVASIPHRYYRLVKLNIPLPNRRRHHGAIFDGYPLSMRVLR